MKNISIILTIILLSIWQNGLSMSMPQDTIVLKIDKRNQSLIGTKDSKNISLKDALSQYLKSEGLNLSDSLWNQIQSQIQSEQEGIDIAADINGKSLKIHVRGLELNGPTPPRPPHAPQAPEAPHAPQAPDAPEAPKVPRELIEFKNGGIRVNDGHSDVYVGLNGIHVKDGTDEVHIGKNDADVTNAERKKQLYDRKGFSMNFGLNGWNIGNQTQIYPAYYIPNSSFLSNYDISKLKSRYVALLWNNYFNIIRGNKSALRLGYGIGFDFLNYRFIGNNYIEPNQYGLNFETPFTSSGSEKNLVKNKLGMAGIQLPIMLHLAFQRKSAIQMIGIGGYVNYGIRDWVKTKEKRFEDKTKNNIDLKRENIRYGLRAEIGLRHFPDLFLNYDLNNLIKYRYGPEITTFSFGLLLF